MRESDLLRLIAERSADLTGVGPIVLGPGDDCAVVTLKGPTLLTVDQVVDGRHIDLAATTLDLVARKAVARSVSDIAAMAGAPVAALATGCLPEGWPHADSLFRHLAYWARSWRCPLVGGDIATGPGPLVLTVTVLGHAATPRGPVLRSGASVGDAVWATGAFGGSFSSGRHLTFEPRLGEAEWLAATLGPSLHAMIDVSDGLGRDAARIADRSDVRIEIEARSIPLHAGVADWRSGAGEGEDYELIFTAAADADLPERVPATGTTLTRIGEVVGGAGCFVRDGAALIDVSEMGWEHGR